MSIAVHGEYEVAVLACQVLGAGDDGVGEGGVVGASEVDSVGNLIEPVCLIDL